ncbi:MAG: hypothetical protein MUF34_11985 [Polyangiaceae bacterium]|nr:hypothetical protein [Polyangiaceae bacterium]
MKKRCQAVRKTLLSMPASGAAAAAVGGGGGAAACFLRRRHQTTPPTAASTIVAGSAQVCGDVQGTSWAARPMPCASSVALGSAAAPGSAGLAAVEPAAAGVELPAAPGTTP